MPRQNDYVCTESVATNRACLEISADNFDNFRFILRGPNQPLSVLVVQNGKAASDGSGSTDWETTLESRRPLRMPDEAHPVWAVEIFSSHIHGSGSYSRLFVFGCRNGILNELMQAGGEGMRVGPLGEGELTLTFGVWSQEDAHCCPSGLKMLMLRWNPLKNGFEVTKTSVTTPKQ